MSKLKSTYRPAPPPPTVQPLPLPSLPEGWTEQPAPDGRPYYYHAATNTSTYDRPLPPPTPFAIPSHVAAQFSASNNSAREDFISLDADGPPRRGFRGGRGGSISRRAFHQNQRQMSDRPKHVHKIPDCAPWVLVKTKLGRRFVHNKETGESLWKFPEDVEKGVIEFDRKELEKKLRRERGEPSEDEAEDASATSNGPAVSGQLGDNHVEGEVSSDSEYTEVEVTDSEAEDDQEGDEGRVKRQRTEEAQANNGPIEFTEDDIEWQLQAMGEEHGLDPGEYGLDEEMEEGEQGLPITDEEAKAAFHSLLDDYGINPFHTWEQIIEDGRIIEDNRYTILPNMRSRRESFAEWSKERIKLLKEQRAKEEKQDPRTPYLKFLQAHAKPKEYWPEFKKKWRKEPVMTDRRLSDKDREKFYREHIKNLQKPEATRRKELLSFVDSLRITIPGKLTSMDALSGELTGDLRYIHHP